MALEITDNNFKEILAEGKPVVIDFWARGADLAKWWVLSLKNWPANMKAKALIGKMRCRRKRRCCRRIRYSQYSYRTVLQEWRTGGQASGFCS